MDRRVASIHASFGGAGCESSRLPLPFALPVSPTISIRVAPNAHPPAPTDIVPSYLGGHAIRFALIESSDCSDHSLRTRQSNNLQVALILESLDVADSVCPESPRNVLPRLIRICFHRSPRFHIYGSIDNFSLAESNFASSTCAADESSGPIRYQHS
jgi:hypothetical protein